MPSKADEKPSAEEQAARREEEQRAKAEGREPSEARVQAFLGETLADPPIYEVMVDTFGAKDPQHVRGDVLREGDTRYDLAEAEKRGVVRRLTIVEVRAKVPHWTRPLTSDGKAVDEDLTRRTRYFTNLPDPADPAYGPNGEHATVTGPQGPAEDDDLAKPTIPDVKGGAPARNPVLQARPGEEHGAVAARAFEDLRKGK